MEDFIANYWGLLLAALIIILALIWLLRGRNGDLVEPLDSNAAEVETDRTDVAPTPEPVGLKPKDNAADAIMAEARNPASESETEAALQKASLASAPAAASGPATEGTPDIAPAVGEADNLQLLKGVGPKLSQRLTALGITRFDQIAAWNERDIAEVNAHLGTFSGRIERDNWVDQAGYLARGDRSGFEAKYGALGA